VDSAEAAQRDLLEFLATCEAMAPPLVADAVLPSDQAPGFAAAPSVAPDRASLADESHGALRRYNALPSMDRDADSEACDRAARSAAEAVDEVTKENLRRLEATMRRLQSEVRTSGLPRATQLAPVRGVPIVQALPVFDAIIDRSSLHRTVHGSTMHGSPQLPIWLREHEAPIRLPPPRRSGGLWRRLVKFFWGCAIAAPIAYVFVITTLPLHKHLADIAGLASAISLSLPTLHAQHAQSSGRELIAIAPVGAPNDTASVAPPNASKHAAAAIPSGVEVVTPVVPEAVPVRVAAIGEVALLAPPDADRASVPEAAQMQADQPVIATAEVGETAPNSTPAPAGEPAAATKPALRQDLGALTEQGNQFFKAGDLIAARILFMRAARAGDAAAAVAMGATYDPVVLAERGVRGVAADPDKARAWYERAKDMGSSEGPRRLETLANR
jgi:hypothetical protein